MKLPVRSLALACGLLLSHSAFVQAQVPPPPPPTPTIWSFLGIPHAHYAIKTQMVNRHGKHPGLEPKPLIKAIADPANLESPFDVIKVAAKVKQAEDAKPQKIKAIKYLAKMGCSCYDKDKEITKALVSAMGDCTEDVRKAAVEAIGESAMSECCATCSQRSCCNEDITAMLSKLAYEHDEMGCFVEPSAEVRQAAADALQICCPNCGPPDTLEEPPMIEGTLEAPMIEGAPPAPMVDPAPAPPVLDAALLFPPLELPSVSSVGDVPESANETQQRASSRRRAQFVATQDMAAHSASQPAAAEASQQRTADMLIDPEQNIAQVRFSGRNAPRIGERLRVFRPTAYGFKLAGELEVFQASSDAALVRPIDNLELATIGEGSMVVRADE